MLAQDRQTRQDFLLAEPGHRLSGDGPRGVVPVGVAGLGARLPIVTHVLIREARQLAIDPPALSGQEQLTPHAVVPKPDAVSLGEHGPQLAANLGLALLEYGVARIEVRILVLEVEVIREELGRCRQRGRRRHELHQIAREGELACPTVRVHRHWSLTVVLKALWRAQGAVGHAAVEAHEMVGVQGL